MSGRAARRLPIRRSCRLHAQLRDHLRSVQIDRVRNITSGWGNIKPSQSLVPSGFCWVYVTFIFPYGRETDSLGVCVCSGATSLPPVLPTVTWFSPDLTTRSFCFLFRRSWLFLLGICSIATRGRSRKKTPGLQADPSACVKLELLCLHALPRTRFLKLARNYWVVAKIVLCACPQALI